MKNILRSIAIPFLLMVIFSGLAHSANPMFRSRASGNWDAASTWEYTTNGGSNWLAAVSFPTDADSIITIRSPHNVTVPTGQNLTANEFIVGIGGTLTLDTGSALTITNGNGDDLFLYSNGTITGTGILKTIDSGTVLRITGSGFNAPFEVVSGITTVGPSSEAQFGNSITIDSGAILSAPNNLRSNSTVINNGRIGGNRLIHYGSSIINNGIIAVNYLDFYSSTSISGSSSSTWSNMLTIRSGGIVTIPEGYIMNFGNSPSQKFTIGGGILNLDSNTLTLNNSGGTFTFEIGGGSITNPGLIKTTGTIALYFNPGFMTVPVEISSGTTICTGISLLARFNKTVTINAGAILNCPQNVATYNTVTNNGTITGGHYDHIGSSFVNNGTVSFSDNFFFRSINQTVTGTGSFASTDVIVYSNCNLTLGSNHQFDNINIYDNASLDLSDKVLKLNGSGYLISKHSTGSFISPNGTVECNRDSAQTLSVSNVNFVNLRINNSSGVSLGTNINVSGTLEIANGDLNTNTRVITLDSSATLSETPWNTVTGDEGYIVTTRNIGIPNNLNVGNMGATLTSAADFGITSVRRYHAEQPINSTGNKSIKRFFIITPANNSNLNATFKFEYDESELNGNEESLYLSQYKSTNGGVYYLIDNSSAAGRDNNIVSAKGINSFSRHTVSSSGFVNIKFTIQGFYNPSVNAMNMKDTVRAFVAKATSPFNFLDSAKSVLDSVTLRAIFRFTYTLSGDYYFVVRHRNSIETWSKLTQPYIYSGNSNYTFTAENIQAFGNNMIQVDASPVVFGIYSGDVNQNGFIDLTDVILINNAASSFAAGYLNTDLNGNSIVDLNDVLIAYNNSNNFVSVKKP